MELDRINRKIIAQLMADASIPVARLAEAVGLSQTPCWKRVQKLHAEGIIRGQVAVVDPEAVGFGLTAFVAIEAQENTAAWHQRFGAIMNDFPEVMEVHRLAGETDYVCRVVVRDMPEFDRLCRRLNESIGIRKLSAQFALERVKCATVLPIDTCSP